jgi:hypothetical protein
VNHRRGGVSLVFFEIVSVGEIVMVVIVEVLVGGGFGSVVH